MTLVCGRVNFFSGPHLVFKYWLRGKFMRIIIVGCGKVGSSIASELNLEGHEISVVDINHGAVDKLANSLDVLGIEGNGATYDVLIEAGAEYADLLIAATARDEINLYSCLMAKAAGVTHTIARVRNPEYTNDLYRIKEHLGLSMAINPEQTAANEISRLLRFSGALEIDSFSKGVVELIKVTVPQNSSIVGTALSRVDNLRGKVRICTVERGDEMFIPNGDFVINGGDRISVVAKPEIAAKFFKRISIAIGRSKDVILLGGGKVFYLKIGLSLFDAGSGQGAGLVLFVHNVITIGLFVGGDLILQFHHHALVQGAHKAVHLCVQAGRILAAAGDDQGRAGLIDQDGVHLVHDGVGVAALHHVGLVGHHVVAQVVKAELIVGAVGDIGIVGGPAGVAVHALYDQANGQPQPAVELAHPLAVALCQIVVDGNDVHPFTGQGVQIGGQGSHKGLAFTGLHLGNIAAVQGNAAGHLHREVLHAQHTPCSLAADGKGIRQKVVQRFALGQLLLEHGSLRL